MWGPARFPQGWSKRRVSCSSSWRRRPRWAAHAPPAHSCDTDFQRCLPGRRWTAAAPRLSSRSELCHSEGWMERLRRMKSRPMRYERLWKNAAKCVTTSICFCQGQSVFTVPALVVHIEHNGGEGGLSGSLRDCGIVQVTQFGISFPFWIPDVLTQHHIRHGHGSDALQHLHLQERIKYIEGGGTTCHNSWPDWFSVTHFIHSTF